MIHFEPIIAIARVYRGDACFDDGDPYDAVFTVVMPYPGLAILKGGHGELTIAEMREIAARLQDEFSVRVIELVRRGRTVRVEVGRLLAPGPVPDTPWPQE